MHSLPIAQKSLEAEEKENVLGEVDGTSEGMVLEASQPVDAMTTEKADSTPTVRDDLITQHFCFFLGGTISLLPAGICV